jgi:hypothetical protein
MSVGAIQPYKLDPSWIIVRNLRSLALDWHSFEAWDGERWTRQIGSALRFETEGQAERYVEENEEQLLGARFA